MKLDLKINDPEIIKVKTFDNNEKLVSLYNFDKFYLPSQVKSKISEPDSKELFVRETVKDSLERALKLLPDGFGFLLLEGYRSYALQKELFNNQLEKVLKNSPLLSVNEASIKATQLVSNPDVYSPHLTGGAVDTKYC